MDGAAQPRDIALYRQRDTSLRKSFEKARAVDIALNLCGLGLAFCVDAERAAQCDVALLPITRERREIVRGEGGDRLAAIVGRRLEPAVGRSLEIENRAARY